METRRFTDFTAHTPVTKTLGFELRPQGKSLERLSASGILEEDFDRAKDYLIVKDVCSEYHRDFIERALTSEYVEDIDWADLAQALCDLRHAESADRYEMRISLSDLQQEYQRKISELFTKGEFAEEFKFFKKKELTLGLLPDFVASHDVPEKNKKQAALLNFKKFTGYLADLNKNYIGIYACDDKKNTIAYRIVNENFTRFEDNAYKWHQMVQEHPDLIELITSSLADKFSEDAAQDIKFDPAQYSSFLSQSTISYYNAIIGGWVDENTNQAKGINGWISEYNSQHQTRIPLLSKLYKQVLFEEESHSFISPFFDNDGEMAQAIHFFEQSMDKQEIYEQVEQCFDDLAHAEDLASLYLMKRSYTKLSQLLFEEWHIIKDAIKHCQKEKVGPTAGMKAKEAQEWAKEYISYADLKEALALGGKALNLSAAKIELFELKQQIADTKGACDAALTSCTLTSRLQDDQKKVEAVKAHLDALLAYERFIRLFSVPEDLSSEDAILSEINLCLQAFLPIEKLYNMVRNHLTKKPSDTSKVKLTFGSGEFGAGWATTKEAERLQILLLKDGKYYLGIFNKKNKPAKDAFKHDEEAGENCYKKVVFSQIKDPEKSIPHSAFAKGNRKKLEELGLTEELQRRYKAGDHKVKIGQKENESFDLAFCHELIDYFKKVLMSVPGYAVLPFNFSDTSTYKNMADFYTEVTNQGYSMLYADVAESTINDLVEEGKLFLFQIYNHDFAEGSKGNDDVHTLLFKSVFDPENFDKVKLLGGIKVFYRFASIKNPYKHKKGETLVSKWVELPDGTRHPLPDDVYKEISRYVNNQTRTLSDEAERWHQSGLVKTKEAYHDYVKDRRFTTDKLMLQIPISINWQARSYININNDTLEYVQGNENLNIVGVHRGERTLLAVSVINSKGEVLLEKDLNVINKFDYHAKLHNREQRRKQENRSWQSQSDIKNLKNGYLSYALAEIVKLAVEYQAIIAIEDLSREQKRSRVCFEKQVYQNFERMLVTKLNYLVADKSPGHKFQPGGLLSGYQLTAKYESVEKLGRQSGFVFFVPAAYTSRVDPATGFVNQFKYDDLNYKNAKAAKEFFAKFDEIKYNAAEDMFSFDFSYAAFGASTPQDKWTLWTGKDARTFVSKQNGKHKYISVHVTEAIKDLFEGYSWVNDLDMKPLIEEAEPKQLQELLRLFRIMLNMRYYRENGAPFFLSPVKDGNGNFYYSDNADLVSAQMIAMRALEIVSDKIEGKISKNGNAYLGLAASKDPTGDWLRFIQEKPYL